MGIPKLVSLLQPYSSHVRLEDIANPSSSAGNPQAPSQDLFPAHGQSQSLPREETQCKDRVNASRSLVPTAREAIIDGPALSYHAYGVAVASRHNAANALDATPCYAEINAIVLDCLSVLEDHGLHIAVLFFDGVLPSSKEATRFERLNSSRKQLQNFRNLNPSLIAEPGKTRRMVLKSPFSLFTAPEKLKGLPALPFLVPSVIEYLSSVGRYRSRTLVVPNEADVYCAKYASLYGGIIFTSDSDLLVYDMAEETSVILFKDITLVESSGGKATTQKSTLRATKFSPTSIACRLGISSLQPFAHSVQKDPYRGLAGCLTYAKKLEANKADPAKEKLQPQELNSYQAFLSEYSLTTISLRPPTTALQKALATLDPRISEWIHLTLPPHQLHEPDFPDDKTVPVKIIDYAEQVLDMYLPFPIDDPVRATSWNVGVEVRRLAYSLLRPGKNTTNEWTRRGVRIGEKKIEHLRLQELINGLQDWIHLLLPLQSDIGEKVAMWRVVCLYVLCMELSEQERDVPKKEALRTLLARKTSGRDWSVVHSQAQMDAVFYSFRLLHQVVSVYDTLPRDTCPRNAELDGPVHGISLLLQSLPRIPLALDSVIADETLLDAAVATLCGLLGVDTDGKGTEGLDDEKGFKAAASKKRRKRRKEELKSKLAPGKVIKTPKAANLFDVLGLDG